MTFLYKNDLSFLIFTTSIMLFVCNIFQERIGFLGCYLFSNSFNYNFSCRDLSFNKLRGEIPSSFASLQKSDYMYAF
jgi:hypothetical protein